MKFTRLRLINIGAFHGNYDFDLTTKDIKKNVVLFGGQNGSGKTTILESLRLALFGPLSFGYKTDTSSYYEKIDAKLNSIAKKNGERFQIILDLEMVENFKRQHYTLNRSWDRNKKSIKEQLVIKRNGDILNEKESEIFQSKMREETPPQLFELCLFDGERISQIISDETLPAYLRDTAKVMFNLDLFENLEADLNGLIKQDSIYGSLSKEEKQLHESEQELKHLRTRYQNIVQAQGNREIEIEDSEALLAELNKNFEIHGGLIKEKRDALLNEMNSVEKQRGIMMEKNKEIIATVFPFALVGELIDKAVVQLKNESVLDVRNNVKNIISSNDVKDLLKTLHISNKENLHEDSNRLYEGLLDLLNADTDQIFHNASYQQRAELESLHLQVKAFQKEEIQQNYKQNAEMLAKVSKIRKQIDENDSASDLKKLMDSIHDLQSKIASLKLHQEQQKENLMDLSNEIAQKEQIFEQLKTKIVRAKKAENVFVITNRVLDISTAFRTLQIKKKLQQVEWETTRMLQSLFRKELFVYKVSLDPETFQLRLFSPSNEEINKDSLSAGEKQILLLATVWAMVKCSRKRIPFVFDTLFGRLDQTHRKSLIQHLIPGCGDQVIILATDSEINADLFQEIEPLVAKSYTIDFNTRRSTVEVTDQYFTYSIPEVTEHELSSQNL